MDNEELVARIKAGIDTDENMLTLWQQNKGVIYLLAKKYSAYADMEDLQQEGYLALYEAVKWYEEGHDVAFIHYAIRCIKRRMLRYIYNNGTVRIPEHMQVKVYKYKQTVSRFQSEHGRKPTADEIASFMGVSGKVVHAIEKTLGMAKVASLDVPILTEDSTSSMVNMVPDKANQIEDVLEDVQREELREVIWNVVDSLPGKQGAVIRSRYQDGRTLKETGEALNISFQMVGQYEKKAITGLRHGKRAARLRPFLDDDICSISLRGSNIERFNRTWTSSTEMAVLKMYESMGE